MKTYTWFDHALTVGMLICAAYLLSGCGHKPVKAPVIITVPARCTIVDSLYDCDAQDVCKAHVKIKPDPECNQFRKSDILQVNK